MPFARARCQRLQKPASIVGIEDTFAVQEVLRRAAFPAHEDDFVVAIGGIVAVAPHLEGRVIAVHSWRELDLFDPPGAHAFVNRIYQPACSYIPRYRDS